MQSVAPKVWLLAFTMAAVTTTAQLVLFQALQRAPLSVLTPFAYAQLAFAGVISWWIFGQTPTRPMALGMLVIAGSGIGNVMINAKRTRTEA